MNTVIKKGIFIAGISVLALTDITTAIAYLGVEDSLFIGDALAADMV